MLENEGTGASSATPDEIKVQMPRHLVCQELPRERKRWIRPPLIGQASAAEHSLSGQLAGTNKSAVTQTVTAGSYKSLPEYSNSWSDIQAFTFQHHGEPEIGFTPVHSQSLSFPLDTRIAKNNTTASMHSIGHQNHGALTVIENVSYIVPGEYNVTKENKLDPVIFTGIQDSGATNEEVPATIPESPNARAPSPASVSSVTSSRRLEWDSGADVGYLTYHISDKISISGHDMSTIERIALAQGCSTALSLRLDPEGTICPGQQSSNTLQSNHIKAPKSSHQIGSSKTLSATDPTNFKYIVGSVTTISESENELTPNDSKSDNADSSMEENVFQRLNGDKNTKGLNAPKELQCENGMQVKSSSLSSLNELESQNLKDSNILHRSQSHNSVSTECVNQKYDHSYPSLLQKNSNMVTNSLSSSSLATVVSKRDYRKTSNKRTQTLPYALKQSVAVQVYDEKHSNELNSLEKSDKNFQSKHSYFEHVSSADHSEMILEKTIDAEISIDASRVTRSKCDSAMGVVSEQLKTAFQKQTVHRICREIDSSESQDSAESEVSDVKTSQRINVSSKHMHVPNEMVKNLSPSADNNLQENSSWFLNDGTLVEKNSFNNTSQRSSMGAIESAQSFEYLPAHMFENMTKITLNEDVKEVSSGILQKDNLDITSSESSASNTFANDLDRIVTQVTNYLNGRSHSNGEKKKLIQKIVKRLLETKYTDDSSSRESHEALKHGRQTTSHNMVTGERSNETISIKMSDFNSKMPQKAIQCADNRRQLHVHQTPIHLSDKCIGTAFSEESVLFSSTSHSPALEAPVSSSTDGTVYATTTSTSCKSNSISWKKHSVQLEKEYELCKQNQDQNQSQSVLLNFCKTERENQLSWICTEIRHLKRLKQLLEDQERLLETMEKKTKSQGVTDKSVKSSYSSLTDTRSTETSDAKPKRFLVNSSTTSAEQETSTVKSNAVLKNIYRSREKYKGFDFSTTKVYSKHNKEGIYLPTKSSVENMSEIQDQIPVFKEKLFEKPCVCTHKYIEKLREEIKTKISKDDGVQTSLRSSSSSSFKTYAISEKSDHSSSDRINVYVQAKDKTSSSDELKDYKTTKISKDEGVQTSLKSSSNSFKTYAISGKSDHSNRINVYVQTKDKTSSSDELKDYKTIKISKDEGVQTSLKSSPSSPFKTSVMPEKSEGYSSSGRINMYIQTKDKTSSSDELKDYKTSKSSGTHKLNTEVPLCCCECKKLCEEVKRKLIERKETDTEKQSECRRSQVVSHDAGGDKLSSSGTLNDAAELTKDSECHAQINSLKETRVSKKAENASVQTSLSFKEAFVRRSDVTNPHKNKQTCSENDNREMNCLCHKLIKKGFDKGLESQAQTQNSDQKSAIRQESLKDGEKLNDSNQKYKAKGVKTKGHTSKKCVTCSASISESSRSKQTRGNPMCNRCYQKTLSSLSTSIRSSPELSTKEPIAYILTLESASEVSIPEQTERKQLKEIVIKVPVKKKTQADTSKNKKQVKQKKIGSVSKENQRPKHKMYCDNSENCEITNGIESLTLREYLMINRPDFIEHAERRRSCLDDLARMRELHQKSKRERLAMAAHVSSTAMKDMKDLPRPPLAIKRVFSQRTMRAQTEQKYRKLPEMQVKKVERKKKEEFRTNRLMAQIFAKKLQKKALRGEVSLSNSKSVISTI